MLGEVFGPKTSLRRLQSATTQILVVACSDHDRACFEQLDSERLVWLQDVANLVVGDVAGGTIEYAIGLKGVKDVVLCAHLDCASLNHILSSKAAELPEAWRGLGGPLQTSIATRSGLGVVAAATGRSTGVASTSSVSASGRGVAPGSRATLGVGEAWIDSPPVSVSYSGPEPSSASPSNWSTPATMR